MSGRFREIREYDDEMDEKQKTRKRVEDILKAYERFHEDIEAARRANIENPPSLYSFQRVEGKNR